MKNRTTFISFLLLLLMLSGIHVFAAKRYWRSSGSNSWSSTANWSSTPSGSGGSSVPSGSDTAYFANTSSSFSCLIDVSPATSITVKRIQISAYSGTITQNKKAITINGDLVVNGGVFAGDSTTITINGALSIAGGAFKSTKSTLIITGGLTLSSGSFDANKGTVQFAGTQSIVTNNILFYNLQLNANSVSNSTITVATNDTLIVKNQLETLGSVPLIINTGVISDSGNVVINNTSTGTTGGGTGTLLIRGTANQTFTGASAQLNGRLCHVKIKKTGGKLTLANNITVAGDWNYISGRIDAYTNSSYVFFPASAGRNLYGRDTLYNVTFYGDGANTNTLNDTLVVKGTLKLDGGSSTVINAGTINTLGNITSANTSTASAGSGWINICGDTTQTLTGSGLTDQGRFCNIKVNKPSGTLYLASIFTLGVTSPATSVDWVYVKGTVNPGTSMIDFFGNGNVTCRNGAASMAFYDFYVQSGTRTFTGDINVNRDFIIGAGRTVVAGSYTLKLGRNWDNTGTFTSGTSKVIFNGSGAQRFINSSSGQVLYNVEINKPSGKVYTYNGAPTINDSIKFVKGVIAATAAKPFYLNTSAVVTGASDSSYVCGVVRKTGTAAFSFPVGDTLAGSTGAYHPLRIAALASSSVYTAQYFAHNVTTDHPAYTAISTDSLSARSTCEYWELVRISGSINPVPWLSWNTNSCNAFCNLLRVAYYATATSKWTSMGYDGITTSGNTGTVKAHANSSGKDTLRLVIANPLNPSLRPTISVSANDTICNGGSATLTVSGASTYAWSPATGLSATTGASVSAHPTLTTTYTVIGTNAGGCKDTATVLVYVRTGPTITATGFTICHAGISGTLLASGASTYSWAPSTYLGTTTGSSVISTPAAPIMYTVTGTDAHGCTGTATANAVIGDPVDIHTRAQATTCKDSCNGAASVSYIKSFTYDWSPGMPAGDGTHIITNLCAGTYTCVMTDTIGCHDTATVTVNYARECIYAACCASFSIATTDTAVCFGHSLLVRMAHSGCTDSVRADFGDGTVTTVLLDGRGSMEHTYTALGTYHIRLIVPGNGICTPVGDSITVHVRNCEAPQCFDCVNSFSPLPGKKYVVSGWVKEDSASLSKTSYTYPSIRIVCASVSYTSSAFTPAGAIIDGWQRIEGVFTIPASASDIGIKLDCSSGSCLFDDIRVFPFDGSMKSYVYDPVNMRLVAELDERNYATLYEYDEEGKLVRVKKETEKGVMTIKENRNNTKK